MVKVGAGAAAAGAVVEGGLPEGLVVAADVEEPTGRLNGRRFPLADEVLLAAKISASILQSSSESLAGFWFTKFWTSFNIAVNWAGSFITAGGITEEPL